MKTYELLQSAKALITEESHFTAEGHLVGKGRTTGVVYRDAVGAATNLLNEATCFCSLGALIGALGVDAESSLSGLVKNTPAPTASKSQRAAFFRANRYLNRAATAVINSAYAIDDVNDNWDHETVMKVWDLAIKNAKHRHVTGKHQKSTKATVSA